MAISSADNTEVDGGRRTANERDDKTAAHPTAPSVFELSLYTCVLKRNDNCLYERKIKEEKSVKLGRDDLVFGR